MFWSSLSHFSTDLVTSLSLPPFPSVSLPFSLGFWLSLSVLDMNTTVPSVSSSSGTLTRFQIFPRQWRKQLDKNRNISEKSESIPSLRFPSSLCPLTQFEFWIPSLISLLKHSLLILSSLYYKVSVFYLILSAHTRTSPFLGILTLPWTSYAGLSHLSVFLSHLPFTSFSLPLSVSLLISLFLSPLSLFISLGHLLFTPPALSPISPALNTTSHQ